MGAGLCKKKPAKRSDAGHKKINPEVVEDVKIVPRPLSRLRPNVITPSELRPFDILLIRAEMHVDGYGVDRRVASGIQASLDGIHVENRLASHTYDRVGLIQNPMFMANSNKAMAARAYDVDSFEVLESTPQGIRTVKLRTVLEHAVLCTVRRLELGELPEIHLLVDELDAAEAAQKEQERKLLEIEGKRQVAGGGGGRRNKKKNKKLTVAEEQARQQLKFDRVCRQQLVKKYFDFARRCRVMGKSYDELLKLPELKDMFRFVSSRMKDGSTIKNAEYERLERVLRSYEPVKGDGIKFSDLMPLFRDFEKNAIKMTLTNAEMYELVSAVSSQHGCIHVEEFMQLWSDSVNKSLQANQSPEEPLSGALVSLILQEIGVMERSPKNYFLPMHFAELPAEAALAAVAAGEHKDDGEKAGVVVDEQQRRVNELGHHLAGEAEAVFMRHNYTLGPERLLRKPLPLLSKEEKQVLNRMRHANSDLVTFEQDDF